jgi:DNA-binding beta-propeller fold protein YncE
MLSRDDLGMGYVDALVVSPDAHRVYLGRVDSIDTHRLNLGVLTLDDAGNPVGIPRLYADGAESLPATGSVTLEEIVPDMVHHKLYLVSNPRGGNWAEGKFLTVYDLDANGDPTGGPRSYAVDLGNTGVYPRAIALNSAENRLYLASATSSSVFVYSLDANGEPTGAPQKVPTGGQNSHYDISVSADGKKLYLGAYADGGYYLGLEVLDLDATGLPVPGSIKSFDRKPVADQPLDHYVHFQYTPQALYLHQNLSDTDDILAPSESAPSNEAVSIWPLGADGYPTGDPQPQAFPPVTALSIPPRTHSGPLATTPSRRPTRES